MYVYIYIHGSISEPQTVKISRPRLSFCASAKRSMLKGSSGFFRSNVLRPERPASALTWAMGDQWKPWMMGNLPVDHLHLLIKMRKNIIFRLVSCI